MIVPITLICLLGLVYSNYYPPTQNLQNYYAQWNLLGSRLYKIDLTHLANPQEQCGKQPCPFHVYLEQNSHIAMQPNRNKTVLIVGGLRGNDFLGPTAILNLYGKVKAGKIIYFPLANPSGFMRQQIEAYPTNVNIEQDFPLWGRQKCNQSSAVKILDYLFRTFIIDLTIYLHDGAPGINYSWTSKEFRPNITLEEEPIYEWIGSFISQRYYRFSNQYKQTITQFNFNSQKSDIIDWAFGASQHSQILATICNNKQYEPYTPYMMNGLAVGLSIGEIDSTHQNRQASDRLVINRAIVLVQSLMAISNPYVQIRAYKNKTLEAKIEGCKNASITAIKLFTKNLTFVGQAKLNKTVTNQKSWNKLGTIEFEENKELLDEGELNIEFNCDVSWVNRGTTMLSHYRQYYSQHYYTLSQDQISKVVQINNNPKLPTNHQPTVTVITAQNQPSLAAAQQNNQKPTVSFDLYFFLQMGGIVVLGIFTVCCIINCWQVGATTLKNRLGSRNQKFQMVEYAETLEDDSGITPRGDHPFHKDPHSQAQHLS